MVAYDTNSGDSLPLAWGEACVYLRPPIKIQECFKTSIDDNRPADTSPESQSLVAQAIPQRWMRDYMQLLFGHIVAHIDSKLEPDWKEATIHWVFTVPGSWADFPTVANFKRLAGDAVRLCIGERKASKIIVNFTEAQASAYCLLKHGPAASIEGYTPGKTVLSCDIGGATTDIAVSQIIAPGLLTTPMQLGMHPVGVADISKQFRLHIQQTLENAGVANPMEMAQDIAQQNFLKTFTEGGPRPNGRISIFVPGICSVWRPPRGQS